ncbi:MAG TPA: hypothetical protein VLX92_16600 [Kofleriaceae bacterium]|nr:hypothetical protein [Kofleriaceae bacterium]
MRIAGATLACAALAACNSLLGIHQLAPDAAQSGDPCTGVCECKVDGDCGAHMYCDDEVTSRTCTCVAGYASQSTGCVWSGVIADPGFMTSTSWTLGAGTSITPTATQQSGMLDPGAAYISQQMSSCNGFLGSVSQAITMPRLSLAEPLVAELDVGMAMGGPPPGPGVDGSYLVGTVWSDDAYTFAQSFLGQGAWQVTRACLGEAQYADESTTGAGAPAQVGLTLDCNGPLFPNNTYGFDHFEIVPQQPGECPVPGTVTDGDAEGSDGWTFSANQDGSRAGFVAGVGENGSRGVQLVPAETCDATSASVQMSIPMRSATGSPALSIYHRKSNGQLQVQVGPYGNTLALSPDASGVVDRYCLPAPIHGSATSLYASYSVPNATCGKATTASAELDDVVLTDEPACGTDPYIADAGFESGLSLIGVYQSSSTAAVAIVADSSAPEGHDVLRLSLGAACDSASYALDLVTPPLPPGTGALLSFSYSFPPGNTAQLSLGGAPSQPTFTRGGWVTATACLDPAIPAGHRQSVTFALSIGGSTCGVALGTPATASIDDLHVTADPSCAP